jgi:hypothetical protein
MRGDKHFLPVRFSGLENPLCILDGMVFADARVDRTPA